MPRFSSILCCARILARYGTFAIECVRWWASFWAMRIKKALTSQLKQAAERESILGIHFFFTEVSALKRFLFLLACVLAFSVCQHVGAQDGVESAKKLTADRLFASDRVADIKIQLAEEDWDEIRNQTRSFGDALSKELAKKIFTYVKGDVTIDGVLIENVGIRKKGFIGSLSAERPSLKIKFSEYFDQSPVNGLDRLTLNNNKQDDGRVCQYLSYKLFRESGTHAPRCGFASVSVNGKYLGIYSNVEAIKPQFLKNSFGDASGALYEGTVTDFFPEYVAKFETKNKHANSEYIQAVVDALDVEEMSDAELATIDQLVDVESFIKFWAMESLVGFWDGYCSNQNNYYLYRDPAIGKFHFIPWGLDSAFTENTPLPPFRIRPRSVHGKAILPNMIYRNEKVQADYQSTLMSFLDTHWNEEKLVAEIDRLEAMLQDHVLDEHQKSFARSLRSFRRFIKRRRKAIMGEFRKGSPKLKRETQKPVYLAEMGTAEAKFSTTWRNSDPGKAVKGETVSVSLTVNGRKIELADMRVYAKTDDMNRDNAAVIIHGTNKATGKEIVLGTSLAKSDFLAPSPEPKNAGGVMLEPGSLGMFNAEFKMMFGSIVLEKASTGKGEPVVGKFKMTVGEFSGMRE